MTENATTPEWSPSGRDITIAALDGFELAASVFEPAVGPPGRVVVINPALGAPRGFYRAYVFSPRV
jgi:predicted alpha/beta hydrolase